MRRQEAGEDELLNRIRDKENEISRCQNAAISLSGTLTDQERDLVKNSGLDMELAGYLSARTIPGMTGKESYVTMQPGFRKPGHCVPGPDDR